MQQSKAIVTLRAERVTITLDLKGTRQVRNNIKRNTKQSIAIQRVYTLLSALLS